MKKLSLSCVFYFDFECASSLVTAGIKRTDYFSLYLMSVEGNNCICPLYCFRTRPHWLQITAIRSLSFVSIFDTFIPLREHC